MNFSRGRIAVAGATTVRVCSSCAVRPRGPKLVGVPWSIGAVLAIENDAPKGG